MPAAAGARSLAVTDHDLAAGSDEPHAVFAVARGMWSTTSISILAVFVLPLALSAQEPEPLPPSDSPTCTGPASRNAADFLDGLQGPSGQWPASLALLDDATRAVLAPGKPEHDLATTAVMLWTLHSDGHSLTRGAEKARVRRSIEWLSRAVLGIDDTTLAPGEALACVVLTDLARWDEDPTLAAAGLRTLGRVLETQNDDGGWTVSGFPAAAPRSIEATGWATWVLRRWTRTLDGPTALPAADRAYQRALGFLRDQSDSRAASVFTLYFDVVDGRGDGGNWHDRFRACSGQLSGEPQLAFVANVTALQIGGETWKVWRKGEFRGLVDAQIKGGPAKAFWPVSGDPRGSLFDLGFNLLSTQIYYRYARNGFVQ